LGLPITSPHEKSSFNEDRQQSKKVALKDEEKKAFLAKHFFVKVLKFEEIQGLLQYAF